jgi:hypothetical protein
VTAYETDPRPLAELLGELAVSLNGGKPYGARQVLAAELRVKPATLAGWLNGRPCALEPSVRRLMAEIAKNLHEHA